MVGRPCAGVKPGVRNIQCRVAEQVAYTASMPLPQTDPYPALSARYGDFFAPPRRPSRPAARRLAGPAADCEWTGMGRPTPA